MGCHRDVDNRKGDEFQGESYPAGFEVEEELFSGVCLADAPILFLLCFHRAFRRELAELCRIAVIASSSESERGERGGEIDEIRCRFEFLKLAFDYHYAAEEEDIFSALDAHVKNVICAYSLDHKSIHDVFDTVFSCLKLMMEEQEECSSEQFQELVSCLGIIHSSICHQMLEEEKQVFPLLLEWFSPKQQASLVWEFLCSIPVMLLEDFLPWMISLSPEKQVDATLCIKEIVPEESLQEVIISSLWRHDQFPSKDLTKEGGRGHMPHMIFSASYSEEKWQWKASDSVLAKTECILNDCFHLWNGVIMKSLMEILEEFHQIRSGSSLDADPIVVRLKFLADVVTFYRSALKKFIDPMLDRLAGDHLTGFSAETHLERIQQVLHDNTQKVLPTCEFVEELFQGMGPFVVEVGKQFKFLEAKVFPLLIDNSGQEMQLELFLYMSVGMMPLGLLKFVITWFAACLSNHELGPILKGLNQVDSLTKNSFLSLVHEWLLIGYSGKISVEEFFNDLQRMSETRCSFLAERSNSCSSLLFNLKPCEVSPPDKTEPGSLSENKVRSSCSLFFDFDKAKTYETSYSREKNLHAFFPQMARLWKPVPRIADEDSSSASIMDEPIPLDFILFFSKALKKDLENLVLYSSHLTENFGFLKEFCKRFNLLRHQYEFHSCAEDEWIFPLLEEKEKAKNITHSYAIDHKLQVENFQQVFIILEEMSGLQMSVSSGTPKQGWRIMRWNHLCMKLQRRCKSIQKLLSNHILREEIELWPVIKQCLTIQEQEKVVASQLGRTGAETLQAMIPWLFSSLKPEEQLTVMSLWRKVTKHTNFSDWLHEWWEVCGKAPISEELSSSCDTDSLEIVSRYLSSVSSPDQDDGILSNRIINLSQENCNDADMVGDSASKDEAKIAALDEEVNECLDCMKVLNLGDEKACNDVADIAYEKANSAQPLQETIKSMNHDLEAAIRRISRDSSLDPQKKSRMIQNLLTSRWQIQKQIYHTDEFPTTTEKRLQGQHPSYQDPIKLTLGCKHYKRNCKLLAECCNQLYTCLRCHDESADHSADRRTITKMMCMNCLTIQPVQQTCSTISCKNLSMAKYYCQICKLFDDEGSRKKKSKNFFELLCHIPLTLFSYCFRDREEPKKREIYHCPFCNICRVGKGLGIDYFHCMNCNACMSKSLSTHICREKCFEDNCPICYDSIFTSSTTVKALHCGHLMHASCFQDYTCNHYICPICSKSLGDMKVYFKMLDTLLAEERTPDEQSNQTQAILCNDCEEKGSATFHQLYRKCSHCGSYNTMLL